MLLRLRFDLDLYVNLRPFAGVPGSVAAGADFMVVRENTEGTYAGEGGLPAQGDPARGGHPGLGQHAARGRALRALRLRPGIAGRARHLTLVHKTNVLTFAGDLWHRTVSEVAPEFPDVDWTYNHVDAACIYLVENPRRYDVIVTDNLFGDILTDLAGAVSGGIGFAALPANLNPARTGPSLFEPVHGVAHDIVGPGIANPLAAIHLGGVMLEYLGGTTGPPAYTPTASSKDRRRHGHDQRLRRHVEPGPAHLHEKLSTTAGEYATRPRERRRQCSRNAHHPDGEDLDGRRARRLGRRARCTCSRTPCTTAPASSRASAPTRPAEAWRCSGCATTSPAVRLGARSHDRRPVHGRRGHRGAPGRLRVNGMHDACYLRPLRLPRRRRDGRQPAAVPGRTSRSPLDVGDVPR